eukprot:TRINITY_DN202_c0_g1_i1.p1 TRINITY_DN202_c0_g1~~TRINITY_DN202_c0_g1_i1.p1  ORF type:complete len:425 (-),score=143.23 TRINITY_DN202_c0_g1_i1:136-1410(-)
MPRSKPKPKPRLSLSSFRLLADPISSPLVHRSKHTHITMSSKMDTDNVEAEVPLVDLIDKYRKAADVSNRTLTAVVALVAPGKKVLDLAVFGDEMIVAESAKAFTKGKMEKGIAFPTCISLNNCVDHYSPLKGDETVLKEGDVVKIDLGAHIDGCISVVAHTTICTANPTEPVKGRTADAICAAHLAAEAAVRLLRPGNKNTDVTNAINKIAAEFEVNVVEGVLSHSLHKSRIDGDKVIISKSSPEHKIEEHTFEENEAWAIDIIMTTGNGKVRESENSKTAVYKRDTGVNYQLKMAASRQVLSDINKRFPVMPFSTRSLEGSRAILGLSEIVKHKLVEPYPVLYDRPNEIVVQFKFTALILPTIIDKITLSPSLPHVSSEFKIKDAKIQATLAMGLRRKKKNKKKKKAKAPAAAADASMDTTA